MKAEPAWLIFATNAFGPAPPSLGCSALNVGKLVEPFLGFCIGVFVDCAHADVIHSAGHQQEIGIREDMRGVQRAAKMPANGSGIGQSCVGRSGEISGEQNVLYRNRGDRLRRQIAVCDRNISSFDVGFDERHKHLPQPSLGSRRRDGCRYDACHLIL